MLTTNSKIQIRKGHKLSKTEFKDLAISMAPSGELLEWDFGSIMEMKYDSKASNYLFSDEDVPLHWDGAFHKEPMQLLFYCIESQGNGGETVFVDTVAICNDLTQDEILELSTIQATYKTKKLAHYGGEITVDILQYDNRLKANILRLASKVVTAKNPVIRELSKQSKVIRKIEKMFKDNKYRYEHKWNPGDLILVDNFRYLHGRNSLGKNINRQFLRAQLL